MINKISCPFNTTLMASVCSPYLLIVWTEPISAPALVILFIHYPMPGLHWPVHFLFPSQLQPWKKCIPTFPLLNCVAFKSFRKCRKWANVFPLFQMHDQLISSTKGQLSKVVLTQLRHERQDLPTGKATVDHFSAVMKLQQNS